MTSPKSSEAPFEKLDHYRVVERVGQGGMGDVYRAHDETLGRDVALKVLPAELAREEGFVRRFQSEASAAAKLTHPNIVQIYAIGEDQGRNYFAMQFVEGPTLEDLLQGEPLGIDAALSIVRQLLQGLEAAHQRGFIHRDIKPGNVLIESATERALLADFGLVKSLEARGGHTATGVIMGTANYVSPEQGQGLAVDERSDLYSVGVLLYQMLARKLPFQADTPTAMIFKHVYEPPPNLLNAVPAAPPALAAVVRRLMAKNPADRFASATELLEALEDRNLTAGAGETAEHSAASSAVTPLAAAALAAAAGTAAVAKEASLSFWQRLRSRLLGGMYRRAPKQVVDQLLNTQQQVDGAIEEYAGRCAEFDRLAQQAEEAVELLREQARQHRQAADDLQRKIDAKTDGDAGAAKAELQRCAVTADELDSQAAEQEGSLNELRLKLSDSQAVLSRLRTERDALQARLRSAEATIEKELSRDGSDERRGAAFYVTWTAAVLAGVGLVGFGVVFFGGPDSPSEPSANGANPAGDDGFNSLIRGQIRTVAVAPSQRTDIMWFAVAGTDGAIYSCSFNPRSELVSVRRLPGHLKRVNHVAFSPDGERIASASEDGMVKIWDVSTRELLREFRHVGGVLAVAFSKDGSQLLSSDWEGLVKQWDIQREEEIRSITMPIPRTPVNSLAWSADSTTFLIAARLAGAESCSEWNLQFAEEAKVFPGAKSLGSCITYLPGNRAAFVAGSAIHVHELRGPPSAKSFGEDVACAAFSSDGLRAVSGNLDGSVSTWDLLKGVEIDRRPIHETSVQSIALDLQGLRVVSAAGDGVRITTLESHSPSGQTKAFQAGAPLRSVRLSVDGSLAITASEKAIQVWNLELPNHSYRIASVGGGSDFVSASFSPFRPQLLFAMKSGEVRLREAGSTVNSRILRTWDGHAQGTTDAVFSWDGERVITCGGDGLVRIYSTQEKAPLHTINVGSPVLAISHHDLRLLTADAAGRIRVWDIATGEETLAFKAGHRGPVHALAVSRDGSRAVSAGADRRVIVWDAHAGTVQSELKGAGAVRSLDVFANGTRAVSGSEDGAVRIWDLRDGALFDLFRGHTGAVSGVAVPSSESAVVSAGADGAVRVWSLAKPE